MWRWNVDLGTGASSNVVSDFIIESSDPWMVELWDVEALEASFGLFVTDELDLVDGLFDTVLGSGDCDHLRVGVGFWDLDGGACLLLQVFEHDALFADDELVLFFGDADLLLGGFDQFVDNASLGLENL